MRRRIRDQLLSLKVSYVLTKDSSILIPGVRTRYEISTSLQNITKRYGYRFTTRATNAGLRVWRIP